MHRHKLTDTQWERIEGMLPGRAGSVGVTAKDNRLFVNAIFWINRTGCPWRDLPQRYGHWKNVHRRFSRWTRTGVWANVFTQLGTDADMEWLMIDSSAIRAHQHAAGAKGGSKISR